MSIGEVLCLLSFIRVSHETSVCVLQVLDKTASVCVSQVLDETASVCVSQSFEPDGRI